MQQDIEFLAALAANLPDDERLILCGFAGDPNAAGPSAWKPRPWRPGRDLDLGRQWNAYATVASFGRAGDGSFRRRTETFSAGRALMVDDVGTKVDPGVVSSVPPSARVETSPGNEQWWYILQEPCRTAARFDAVIRAFIAGRLLGADPGMSGVTRVGRIPGYQNAKPAYGGWTVQLRELNNNRFTLEELVERFGLKLRGERGTKIKMRSELAEARWAMFAAAHKFLDQRGMLKRAEPDLSGWTEMVCPWVEDHTAKANTGAAIREPSPENDYYGAFRCHHGHCADKGWAELTDWIDELAVEELQ